MKNSLPPWLNVLCIIFIFATLTYGAAIFMSPSYNYDPDKGIHNFKPFFAAIFMLFTYFSIILSSFLFVNYQLATIILFVLLFVSLIVFTVGTQLKEKDDKTTAFSIASAILGLAAGIPFGDALRGGSKQQKTENSPTPKL